MEMCAKPELEVVRERIKAWRESREKQGPMPAALWSEVMDIAKHVGIHQAAKVLGMSPTRIRERIRKTQPSSAQFVELGGAQVWPFTKTERPEGKQTPMDAGQGMVIEVSSGLTIRLDAGSKLDVATLIKAFQG
jgi:ferric-dicitrate binding protein FerR (iron transport regulator)